MNLKLFNQNLTNFCQNILFYMFEDFLRLIQRHFNIYNQLLNTAI